MGPASTYLCKLIVLFRICFFWRILHKGGKTTSSAPPKKDGEGNFKNKHGMDTHDFGHSHRAAVGKHQHGPGHGVSAPKLSKDDMLGASLAGAEKEAKKRHYDAARHIKEVNMAVQQPVSLTSAS